MVSSLPRVALLGIVVRSLSPGVHFEQERAGAKYLHAPQQSIARWRAMRFGLFIHWGPVSLTGKEIGWSRAGERRGHRTRHGTQVPVEVYDNLYKKFDPIKFKADEWVQIAKDAGTKYLVFTTKHHDGFCNFDTKLTDYKITSPLSPYRKDICAQIAGACQRGGLALGWYYSPPDWHHPDYRNGPRHKEYIKYLHGQIRELLTNYGRVDIMWFDGLGGKSEDWDAHELFRMIRQLQPDILINNRCGLPGDFDTPEQRIGGFNRSRPWETCMTLGTQWAWKPNDHIKSLAQCVETLVRVVGGDGNLLLNVGPMPDGRIEPRQVQRLRQIGQLLKRYGQCIYGTRGGPYMPGAWGGSTCKSKKIFVFILRWPKDGPCVLPPLGCNLLEAKTLSGGRARVSLTKHGLTIDVPAGQRDPVATVVELTIDREAIELEPVHVSLSGSLAFGKRVKASNVYRGIVSHYGPQQAIDDDPGTRWATDAGTQAAWIEVDLGKPVLVGRVMIDECVRYGGARVREFELQCEVDDTWLTVLRSEGIGRQYKGEFKPVRTRRARLNILKAAEGPTIWEFQLFPPKGDK